MKSGSTEVKTLKWIESVVRDTVRVLLTHMRYAAVHSHFSPSYYSLLLNFQPAPGKDVYLQHRYIPALYNFMGPG